MSKHLDRIAKAVTKRDETTARLDQAVTDAIAAAYADGVPVVRIAEQIGATVQTVRRRLRSAGVELDRKN